VSVKDDEENGAIETDERAPRKRQSRFALQVVATFLVAIGFLMIIGVGLGFAQGWLRPAWNDLNEGQASVIASLVTLYAAALAAIVGPLIFTGQIADMRIASEHAMKMVDAQNLRITEQLEHIRKMVRQTEEAVIPPLAAPVFDPQKALTRLEGIREDATALAQSIVETSNKWLTTKDKTKRKWAGRKPYYYLLEKLGFIDQEQRDLFVAISETRQLNPEKVTAEAVAEAEKKLEELKAGSSVPG
jgi:hypothetical protein